MKADFTRQVDWATGCREVWLSITWVYLRVFLDEISIPQSTIHVGGITQSVEGWN